MIWALKGPGTLRFMNSNFKAPPLLLARIYKALYRKHGHRHWWPGDTRFEIIVGAILTQNTSWKNVEKAIASLKRHRALTVAALTRMNEKKLATLIRSAGYFNIKANRIKHFLNFLNQKYGGSLSKMFARPGALLREELLQVKGIGPETADSILLYAGRKPFFVVDAYTKRIFSRHHFFPEHASYEEVQDFFMKGLHKDVELFNDYHAQIVRLGNTLCTKRKPNCSSCSLEFLFSLKK